MAELPTDPRDAALEDFVAAHFASRGAYVETGVTERHPIDILELDIVWTDYAQDPPKSHPVEVKGGKDIHLGDVFKFYGWTRYLGLPPGQFVHREPFGKADKNCLKHIEARTGIHLVHAHALPDDVDKHLEAMGLPKPVWDKLPDLWRFSFWAQRELLKKLRGAKKKDDVVRETVVKTIEYQRLINDAVFFTPDVPTRVSDLLQAHMGHRNLAASIALELQTGKVEFENPAETATFKNALFGGNHFPVQGVFYLTHRARLYILKAAVDYAVGLKTGTIKNIVIKIGGKEIPLSSSPYAAFGKAVDELSQLKSFMRLPALWQTFLWTWGGFILLDRQEAEYERLSQETGVPVNEIPAALTAFDKLFPVGGGWFRQPSSSQRRVLMMMPAAMRGIGAFRRLLMNGVTEYKDLGYKDSTTWHLGQDNNAGAKLLNESKEGQHGGVGD